MIYWLWFLLYQCYYFTANLLTIKIPSDTNLYYYKLHKFIKLSETNTKRVNTMHIRADMEMLDKSQRKMSENGLAMEKAIVSDEQSWQNDIVASPFLKNGSKEWIKMETFGKTHMYVAISLDSKPHRDIHGSWDTTLTQSKELIVKTQTDILDKVELK